MTGSENINFYQSISPKMTDNRNGLSLDHLDKNPECVARKIAGKISFELANKVNFSEGECLVTYDCWPILEKIKKSVLALLLVGTQTPTSPGQYLAYHMERMLGEESYMSQSIMWPYVPFDTKPDDQTLALNKYFMNVAHELSNGKLSEISILDVPGFGSMFHPFKKSCSSYDYSQPPWSLQLNMAIYNQLIKKYNFSWSWKDDLRSNCEDLAYHWEQYMKDPEANPFPPTVINNTFFNYTKYIKEDMTTFLETQTISTQNTNESYWSDLATKVFSETNSKTHVQENGYYDRLIMDCVFKEPLLSHEPNLSRGCGDFYPKLTSNGLCQSFNGIEASQMWKENSEIIQSFSKVFGGFQPHPKLFRGTGNSEGTKLYET